MMAPFMRRTWNPRGETPLLHHCGGTHRKVSAIAALCVSPERDDVRLYFRLHPNANINTERVLRFLGQLLVQVDAPIVLIWDRLNAHRAYRMQEFLAEHPQIVTEFFPPYAPELNPVEYVWGYLKLNPLANLAFFDLEELTTTARSQTRSLQRKPDLLRSFLRHSPLSLRLR
jgi:putative transposase